MLLLLNSTDTKVKENSQEDFDLYKEMILVMNNSAFGIVHTFMVAEDCHWEDFSTLTKVTYFFYFCFCIFISINKMFQLETVQITCYYLSVALTLQHFLDAV